MDYYIQLNPGYNSTILQSSVEVDNIVIVAIFSPSLPEHYLSLLFTSILNSWKKNRPILQLLNFPNNCLFSGQFLSRGHRRVFSIPVCPQFTNPIRITFYSPNLISDTGVILWCWSHWILLELLKSGLSPSLATMVSPWSFPLYWRISKVMASRK